MISKNSLTLILLMTYSFSANAIDLFGLELSAGHEIKAIQFDNSSEPDLKKALENGIVRASELEAARVLFKDKKGLTWTLDIFQNKQLPNGPTVFVPHDNENESFQTGMRSLYERGGHLLALECAEERLCSGVDPNRYFKKSNPIFLKTILRFFESKPFPVITLHNNHDSHRSFGGSGSIYSDMDTPYADGHGFYFTGDPDDLIIFSDTVEMADSQLFERYGSAFENRQLNFIFEEITPHNSLGGHMSTYVLLHTDKAYFNIESQHGHESEQIFYLDELFKLID